MDTLAVQMALAALGYALAPSGVMGRDTLIVLQTFQSGRGLAATGALTPDTIQALRAAMARRASQPLRNPLTPETISHVQFHLCQGTEGRPRP
jgi:peptidoglycan hydrolase-like protein with peptidoglycan-binding domain